MYAQLWTQPVTLSAILLMRANRSFSVLISSNLTFLISLIMKSYISMNQSTMQGCLSSSIIFTNSLSQSMSQEWLWFQSNSYFKLFLLDSFIFSTIFTSFSSPRPGNRNPPSNSMSFFFPFFLFCSESSSSLLGFLLQMYWASKAIRVVLCSVQYSLIFQIQTFLASYQDPFLGFIILQYKYSIKHHPVSLYKIRPTQIKENKQKMLVKFELNKKANKILQLKGSQEVMQEQRYEQNETVLLQQKGVIKKKLILTASNLTVLSSQVDLIVAGDRNKVKIQDSAGKICFVGNDNQIEIKRSWIACKVEGNQNQFNISQTQFQLISHKGEANMIPGVLGEFQVPLRRRIMNERIMHMRNALKQRSENVKKLLPHLLKSIYNSETRECSICYDDIKTGDQVTSLFCFHLFHSLCIIACLETAVKCPVCSLDLLKVINEQIKSGNFVQEKGEIVMKQSMEIEPN